RVQGCFVSTKEVEAVVSFIKSGGQVEYSSEIIEEIEKATPVPKGEGKGDNSSDVPVVDGSDEEIIDRAVEVLCEAGQASVSYLQRKLKLGYARAARIMDQLEELGVVGPYEGSKPRAVIITKDMWLKRKLINNDTISDPIGDGGSEIFDEVVSEMEENT
ncbi:MAG: DNA translocase FtsK, partial [Oscillospiraceae bacterium]